jgi:cytochrome c553
MPQLAKGYTDEQIELIAEWFAAQTSEVRRRRCACERRHS